MAAQTITKVTYEDNVTVIGASNLNAIQDAVNNHASLIDGLDSGKVDKVTGKGLSTNDYNNDAQSKLNNLPSGAELDTSLGQKVDKRTSGTEVYTHSGSTQGGATLTETPTAGAVPQYGTDGVLKAGAPVAANDVVRKAELDEVVDEMSDSTTGLGSKAPAIIETVGPAAIASFDDGADGMPVKKLVANIEPVQDLHGYDHPWPAGGGANQWDEELESGLFNVSGKAWGDSYWRNTNLVHVIPTESYYVIVPNVTNVYCYGYSDTSYSDGVSLSINNGILTIPSGINYFGFAFAKSVYGETYNHDIAINYPSTVTTYSPYSNVCPITGWTGANVTRAGVNVWDEDWENGYYNRNTGAKDGNSNTTYFRSKNYIKCAPNTLYYFKAPSVHASNITYYAVLFYDVDKSFISAINSDVGNTARTTPQNARFMTFYIEVGTSGATYHNDIAINYPATDTAYHAYTGNQISVTFPSSAGDNGTVYGGNLTINPDRTGTLVVDRAVVDLGTLTWTLVNGGSRPDFFNATLPTEVLNNNYISSMYYKKGNPYGSDEDLIVNVFNAGGNGNLLIRNTAYTTAADFKTAMSGVQLVYGLATPTTYQLTASEISAILTTLYGTNNIWADVGSVEVTAPKDTRLFIENLTQPTEDDMTADHAISAGTFFQLGNTLYLATSQIAAGGTITPGTNATKLSLADALNQLNA